MGLIGWRQISAIRVTHLSHRCRSEAKTRAATPASADLAWPPIQAFALLTRNQSCSLPPQSKAASNNSRERFCLVESTSSQPR